ncbi:unnamed protein product [Calypogeia fissa]
MGYGENRSARRDGAMVRFISFTFLLAFLLHFSSWQVEGRAASDAAYADLGAGKNVQLTSFPGKTSGGLLSNVKELWSEKVLGRVFDDLKVDQRTSGKDGLLNFTRAVTLGSYLKLSFIDAIYLPVPINFIFIGFDGEGNKEFKLGEEELQRWFTNIDHILEHTRVPQLGEELTPFYRAKGSGENKHHLPLVSYTHFNYSVHGIELNSRTTAVFERAIKLLARKEDPVGTKDSAEEAGEAVEEEGPEWQVDVGAISHIFQSLVNYLELEKAYNVFVLNPKRDPSHGRYGYRYGLSAKEISFLRKSANTTGKVLKSKEKFQDYLAEVEKIKNPIYGKHPMLKFAWTKAEEGHTDSWVDAVNKALDSLQAALRLKSEEEITLWTAQQILNGNNLQLASALRKGLKSEGESELQPECLVDTWVGQERWAFLDLSAGPFSWGPAVGGDGVRSENSLPSVDASFLSVPQSDIDVDQDAVQEDFENLWRSRFSNFELDEQHSVDLLQAELDVYEMFADRHCKGRKIALTFCTEFSQRVNDVRDELAAIYSDPTPEGTSEEAEAEILKHKIKAAELVKRLDEGNIFGFVSQNTVKFSAARDSFLAHLGSVLTSAMRHVVTPSTADGAFHFYETVTFEVYFITQDKIKDERLLPVDRDAVKAALLNLIVPSQKPIFSFHTLALAEDPPLAMAFASAKRASIVPILLVNGTYRSADRVYLDSLILQHHIKQLDFSTAGRKSSTRSNVEVPIFWFLRSSGEPLLVDKHYQAKALSDMVIVVQSPHPKWESHLQCNGESFSWDLRQPTKAAIAAVAEHMAGLVPSHLTFSPAHENSIQDWLWSVGSHPFSSTSSGWNMSQFHNDAMARNYIITALDESIEVVNSGVRVLVNERTQKAAFSTFRLREQGLRYNFNRVVSLWKQIAAHNEEFRYAETMKLLPNLEISSQGFFQAANETIAALHPVYCVREHKLQTRVDVIMGISLLIAVVVLWFVLRPRRGKPKIN